MLPNMRQEWELILMLGRRIIRDMPPIGLLMCLASAASFGAMGIFGKLAYHQGVTVGTLLVFRFAIASVVLWGMLLATGGLRRLRTINRRDLALGIGLGAIGYSLQSGAYFGGLERISPGLLELLLYAYPAIVTVAAIRLGRARASRRTAIALTLIFAGLMLVLVAAGAGTLDPVGVTLGLTAAIVYSIYILTSEAITKRIGPLMLTTLVCTGATITLTLGSLVAGGLHPGAVTVAGYGWLTAIAIISTVGAVGLFFAGMDRVGPTRAAILSTCEPFITVALAAVAFGETLTPLQLLGATLILGGVITFNVRGRRRRHESAATAKLAPARA